jgi:hypothetical protein
MQTAIILLRKNAAIVSAAVAFIISILALWIAAIGKTIDVSSFLGTVPQWLTALIAGGALLAAYVSIKTQREIARKRAAVDFFLKTEMDDHLQLAHKNFLKGVEVLDTHLAAGKALDEFSKTQEYADIRDYLNLHELLAVGVHQDVVDDNVAFDFWHRELMRALSRTNGLITYIQKQPGNQRTYVDLVALCQRWEARV